MSAQASIATDTREDAVAVPIQAVTVRPEKELAGGKPGDAGAAAGRARARRARKKPRREPLRKVVFVVEGGVAKVRPVETGLASETEIEIVERARRRARRSWRGRTGCSRASSPTGSAVTEEAPGAGKGPRRRRG